MTKPSLDYAFLRYIGVTPENQRQHQRFYLPFYATCGTVIDLGCGDGDFVQLLGESGIRAAGIDSDPLVCAAAQERGLDIVCRDAFDYLEGSEPESVDGIFSSHLVEHLSYERVLELLRLSHRALRPGGTIVLTTPNVRALISHLEMFHLHYDHVSFYHPRLLCFFLEHVGFVDAEEGENASPVSPASPMFGDLPIPAVNAGLPLQQDSWLHRAVRWLRVTVVNLVARPYLDLINHNFDQIKQALVRIDRPFECYVRATKPRDHSS